MKHTRDASVVRLTHQGAIAGVLLVQTACVGTEPQPTTAIPTTNKACLDHAHERQAAGLPALPTKVPTDNTPPPVAVAADLVEGHRISGQRVIIPDNETRKAIHAMHVARTSPAFKLCLDTTGTPTTIELLRSSCFPRYDADLASKMSEWRYSPYLKDGVAVAVCTAITFIYNQ